MYPYFKICTYGNHGELEAWADHFKGLNIPYAITRRRKGEGYSYALWRMGQEVMGERNEDYAPNDEPLDGEIVETWGGFENYLGEVK